MIAVVGFFMCVVFYTKWPHFFKFRLGKAIKFMLLHVILATVLATSAQYAGISKYSAIEKKISKKEQHEIQKKGLIFLYNMPLWQVALAGFEDAIYVLPLLPVKNVYLLGAGLTASTIHFTSGHFYQGISSMLGKVHFVGLAYYFASRYGILTTMIAHAANDVIALWSLKRTLNKLCGTIPIKECLDK